MKRDLIKGMLLSCMKTRIDNQGIYVVEPVELGLLIKVCIQFKLQFGYFSSFQYCKVPNIPILIVEGIINRPRCSAQKS
uniref:Uncharacterized protein n=1 Tax=Arundo donax TaxID=35708 RepID=A0A0A9FS05_ARUDO